MAHRHSDEKQANKQTTIAKIGQNWQCNRVVAVNRMFVCACFTHHSQECERSMRIEHFIEMESVEKTTAEIHSN